MKKSILWGKYHHLSLCYFLIALALMCSSVDAQEQKIISLVNGHVITNYDVEQRMRLLQLINQQAQGTISQEQIIEELIEEQLIMGEAKRLNIEAPGEQIAEILKTLAGRMNNTVEEFTFLLWKEEGIDINTLKSRISTQLIWKNIVISKFEDSVQVKDQDIDQFLAENGGGHLLKRYEYDIKNVTLLLGKDKSKKATQQRWEEAQRLARQISSCATLTQTTAELRDVVVGKMIHRKSEDLSPKIQKAISGIKINGTTPPYITNNSVKFLVICNKKEILDENISRLNAQNKLSDNKLYVLTKKYLNELKRQAVIEHR